MNRKFPFKFDLDENADPVEELHRLRVATSRHFKTLDAIMDYHRSMPPVKELIADLDAEIAKKRSKATKTGKAKAAIKPARQQKTAKRLTPT